MQNVDESVEIKNSILASNELESSLPQTSTGRPRRSKLKCSHEGCTFEVGHRLLMERHVFEAHDDENSDIDVDSPPEEEIPKRKRKHLCPKNGCNKRFVSLSHFRRHESVHDKEGPTFQCHVSDCTETFSDNSSLDRHQQNAHHDEGTHICTEVGCSERFWFASALKQHQLQHDDHTVKKIITKKFVCEIPGCAMRFETMANLRRHQKYHDRFDKQRNEKMHKCTHDGCWRSFYTFSHLQRHQKYHDLPPKEYILEKGIHICKQCNRSFPRAAHLRRHELIHENYKFVCKHKGCTMRYADAERLKRHQKLNHDEVAREAVLRHACTQKGCTWTFSCASHLQRHLLTHEKSARPTAGSRTIPEEKYAPESVDSEDSEDSMENLKIESILSKEESDSELLDDEDAVEKVSRKDYICSEEGCTAIYRTAYHFRRHIEDHEAASHLDPLEEITQIFIEYSQPLDQPEEPDKPEITTKNVTRFSDSSEHTEVSEMVANEQHQVVHKNSSKKSVLKNHICLECSKGFSKPSHLLRHQKVHDGRARQRQCVPKSQKSKICLECSKEFSSNKSLLRHQVVHDSHARQIALDRNVCLIDGCNKRYTQAEALRKHHQVKHTAGFKRNSNQVNQLFTCPECSKAFPSLNRLLLHKVVHDSTDRQIASNRNVCKLDGCNKRFSDASHLRQHELTHTKNAQRISRNVPTPQTIQMDTSSRDTDDGDIDPLNIVKLEQIKMETSSIDEVTIDDKSDVFKILPYDEACRLLQQWEVNSKQPTDVNSHVDGTE